MRRVRRVTISSAAKVGAALGVVVFAIFAIPALLCQSTLLAGLSSFTTTDQFGRTISGAGLFGGGLLGLACAYGVGLVAALIGGALSGAIYAFAYNYTYQWTGGLEIEVE